LSEIDKLPPSGRALCPPRLDLDALLLWVRVLDPGPWPDALA